MRKSIDFTVKDDNRDKDKLFVITEMPAYQAEQWAIKAFFAMMNAGIEIPQEAVELGMAGLADTWTAAIAGVPFEKAEPLLAEMFGCVKFIPDPTKRDVDMGFEQFKSQIEEPLTFLKLRKAVFDLHIGFLGKGAPSTTV